jgi:caffeoyl-CoA O-methyltransferase
LDEHPAEVARQNIERAGLAERVEIRVGDARELLARLAEGDEGPFDLVFIDADKANYLNYYEYAVKLVRAGGLILIDNVLWSGEVVRHPAPDSATAAIQELNRTVASDPRVRAVLVTIRDGVLVVRKT